MAIILILYETLIHKAQAECIYMSIETSVYSNSVSQPMGCELKQNHWSMIYVSFYYMMHSGNVKLSKTI